MLRKRPPFSGIREGPNKEARNAGENEKNPTLLRSCLPDSSYLFIALLDLIDNLHLHTTAFQ
jgi:hypothetical protein